jgi:Flp pilus assembly pilin Flp
VNRRGATTVEYALLLSLFVLVLIAALYTVSGAVSDMWVAIEAGFGG